MTLSHAELSSLVRWWAPAIEGAAIQELRCPDVHRVAVKLRRPGQTRWLLLEAGTPDARLHGLERGPRAEGAPPALQGLLRKELRGRVVGLDLDPGDRVVTLSLSGPRGARYLRALLWHQGGGFVLLDGEGARLGAAPARLDDSRPAAALPDDAMRSRFGGLNGEALDEAVAAWAEARWQERRLASLRAALARPLRRERKRLRRLLQVQRDEAGQGEVAQQLRAEGELLRGSFHLLRKGLDSVKLPDWSSGETIEVALDPRLDPGAQVDARFTAARRAERRATSAAERSVDTAQRLAAVEARLATMDDADADALAAVALARGAAPGGRRRGAPKRRPWRTWSGPAGHTIRSGRSATDNDALLRASRGRDVWLHARGRAGAHVVIPDPGESPPLDLLLAAAQVAALGSRAPRGELIEVAWTRVRHVRKPKGAPRGLVLVHQERVLLVTVDRAQLPVRAEP